MANSQKLKRRPLKIISIIFFLFFFILALGIYFFRSQNYILNVSNSLPLGIYQKLEIDDLKKDDLVIIDIQGERRKFMIERGYIDGKLVNTMLKKIVGVEGDLFEIYETSEGKILKRNGRDDLGNVFTTDSNNRPLPVIENKIILAKDEFFVMGTTKNSFDSRYIGKIKKYEILYKARPILTF